MFSFVFFILSGVGLVAIILAKNYEEKRGKTPFLLKAVSRSDEYIRDYHHRAIHNYAEGKERGIIFLTRQLPLRVRNLWYKSLSLIEERAKEYLGNMRDAKLLKRSDGISEFFKNISDIEKGVGEINEEYLKAVEQTVSIPEPETSIETRPKRIYTRKKIPVVEVE